MKKMKRERLGAGVWAVMILVLIGTVVICVGAGSVYIAPGDTFRTVWTVFWAKRCRTWK